MLLTISTIKGDEINSGNTNNFFISENFYSNSVVRVKRAVSYFFYLYRLPCSLPAISFLALSTASSEMLFMKRTLREHLLYGFYALVLVGSLTIYQKTSLGNSLSVAQKQSSLLRCDLTSSALPDSTPTVKQPSFKLILKQLQMLDQQFKRQVDGNRCLTRGGLMP